MSPTAPPSRCIIGTCNEKATHRGRCDTHYIPWEQQSARNTGITSTERKRFRDAVLARDPMCMHCHIEPAAEADHIISVGNGGSRTDIANGQGLCTACHDTKTRNETTERHKKRKNASKLRNA